MERILAQYSNFSFVDEGHIYCHTCSQNLVYTDRGKVQQHLETKKHMQNAEGKSNQIFYEELCQAFIAANIPLKKLDNPVLRGFLSKYMKRNIPDQSTIRKIYIEKTYDKVMLEIKTKLSSNYLWVSADETIDIKGRCVVNVIVGILHPENPSEQFLVATVFNESVNADKMCSIVKNAVRKVCGEDVSQILLFVSDAASVMLKTGKLLKEHFPNLLHVTCFAHALHRVCEFIRDNFPDVNSLVSLYKKILLKSPHRVSLYRQICPNLPLPPQPVVTRWGTWLEAVFFYAKYFNELKLFTTTLENDSKSVHELKILLRSEILLPQIEFIATNFSKLPETITFLQTKNLKLSVAFEHFEVTLSHLQSVSWPLQNMFTEKIKSIVSRNPDYLTLKQLMLNQFTDEDTLTKFSHLSRYFLFAPSTSSDVERSFSRFKDILTSNRNQFTEENLEKYAVIQFFFSNISS